MLGEGRRRRDRGADVVVGYVETHGREFTAAQLDDLEVVPRRTLVHRDATFEEMDLDAIIARAPRVVLVDELAHTNVPGSTHEKRWQDIDTILDAGIDVISTVNIQHLESMNDVVERITGIRQLETVPDAFVRRADQIELVDMTPEALRRRLAHGNVYPSHKVDAALANYFRPGNLAALRELALLWVADRVEDGLRKYMTLHDIDHPWETRERVLVAITGAPGGDHVIRRAARMAGRSAGELLGVFVSASDGLARRAGPGLDAQRRLLDELGGRYLEVVGDDVAMALVGVARAERATQLVLGASRRSSARERLGGSIVAAVLRAAGELDVHVISSDVEASEPSRRRRVRHRGRVSARRRLTGAAIAVIGLPLLTAVLDTGRDVIELPSVLLVYLVAVIAIATIGGTLIGLGSALAAFGLSNYYFIEPTGTLQIDDPDHVVALVVFLTAAGIVSTIVGVATRRSEEAHRARAEAEALARSSASLVTEADPVPAVLEHLRLALGATAARLETRSGETWHVDGSGRPNRRRRVRFRRRRLRAGRGRPRRGEPARRHRYRPQRRRSPSRQLVRQPVGRRSAGPRLATRRRDGRTSHGRRRVADRPAARRLARPAHTARHHQGIGVGAVVRRRRVAGRGAGRAAPRHRRRDRPARSDHREPARHEPARSRRARRPAVARRRRRCRGRRARQPDGRRNRDCVTVSVDPELPPVVADAALLERAVANLVSNAVTASCGRSSRSRSRPGSCRPNVSMCASSTVVRDCRRTDRIRLFEPFQRLDDRGGPKGLGLGLAIARRFVDSMGGELVLDDTPGGGVTATIRLQVARR